MWRVGESYGDSFGEEKCTMITTINAYRLRYNRLTGIDKQEGKRRTAKENQASDKTCLMSTMWDFVRTLLLRTETAVLRILPRFSVVHLNTAYTV